MERSKPGEPILTDDDLLRLRDASGALDRAEEMLSKAQLAGLADESQIQEVKVLRKQLLQIGNTYFPGKGIR